MAQYHCPACGAEMDIAVEWHQDGDGDGIYARTFWVPELAEVSTCLECDTEPDADTIDRWLDQVAVEGYNPEPMDY